MAQRSYNVGAPVISRTQCPRPLAPLQNQDPARASTLRLPGIWDVLLLGPPRPSALNQCVFLQLPSISLRGGSSRLAPLASDSIPASTSSLTFDLQRLAS